MQEKLWVFRAADRALQHTLSQQLSISPVTASVLLARGVTTPDEATRWMSSVQGGLHDPFLLPDMELAVERLHQALARQERVCFYGDYDVDGVSATSLYLSFYQGLGGNACGYIPHRVREGYGLNEGAVRRLAEAGISLLVTSDCGTTSHHEIAVARELGVDVIVTDHHQTDATMPAALAVLNPHRRDAIYPFKGLHGRNADWTQLYNADVISMPDKWEYPWYAAWDLAFHCLPIALVDPRFAKDQLVLMLREWYMHPNGQIPAYEWALGDVNPPVHAWAAWRVYKIEKKRKGVGDRIFLERVFHKLLLNFTWWVNRKDAEGKNIFQGGFLGLDNIGVFDRSKPLPTGGHIEQSDATSWMGMYCLNMLSIALELAREDRAYEDVASKFFEHFVYICRAMNNIGDAKIELWNKADGFFYDVLHLPDGKTFPMSAWNR